MCLRINEYSNRWRRYRGRRVVLQPLGVMLSFLRKFIIVHVTLTAVKVYYHVCACVNAIGTTFSFPKPFPVSLTCRPLKLLPGCTGSDGDQLAGHEHE